MALNCRNPRLMPQIWSQFYEDGTKDVAIQVQPLQTNFLDNWGRIPLCSRQPYATTPNVKRTKETMPTLKVMGKTKPTNNTDRAVYVILPYFNLEPKICLYKQDELEILKEAYELREWQPTPKEEKKPDYKQLLKIILIALLETIKQLYKGITNKELQ